MKTVIKKVFFSQIFFILLCTMGCAKKVVDGEEKLGGTKRKEIVLMGPAFTLQDEKLAWDKVIDDFTKKSEIKVVQNRQGTWDDTLQKLQTARISKIQTDLVVVGMGTISSTLGPAGSVMDITELMKPLLHRFPEGVLSSCRRGNHLWAIPFQDASGTTCFYNKDIFVKYGLSVPTSLEEWEYCAKVFKSQNIIPFLIQGQDTWAWAMPFFDTYGQATKGKSIEFVEAWLRGEKSFEDQYTYNALYALKRLYDSGILGDDSFATNEDSMLANFVQQKCAMIFGGTWIYPPLLGMKVPFEFDACEFPALIKDSSPCHAFAAGDGAIAIPSWIDQDNLPYVMQFVEFITRPENARTIICANAGGNPIFEVVKGAVGEIDTITSFLQTVSVPHSVTYLDWIWPGEVNDAICKIVPSVMRGMMSAEEAAEYVQHSLDKLVVEEKYIYDWWNHWSQSQWEAVTPKVVPDISSYIQ